MPALRCPHCGTVVRPLRGATPLCPTCGFGSAAQPAAAPAATSDGISGGAIAAIVIVAFLLVAGAAAAVLYFATDVFDDLGSGGGPLTQAQAEARAQSAIQDFAADVEGFDGGELKGMDMTFSGSDPDFGSMAGTMLMEWGSNGVFHMSISISGGPLTITFETFCSEERNVVVFQEAFESRPNREECMSFFEDDDADGLNVTDPDDMEIVSVTPNANGTVTVELVDEEGTQYTALIDDQGRLTRMRMEDDEMTAVMRMSYAARTPVTMPATTQRLPASVFLTGGAGFDNAVWEVLSADEGLPRNEFTVYLKDSNEAIVAQFPLDQATATDNGYTFAWIGDADGFLEEGDSFGILRAGTDFFDYYPVLYDEWAQAEVGSVDVPAPGLLLGVLALLGAGLIARRR